MKENPVQKAYDMLVNHRDNDAVLDIDEVIGFLGEALDSASCYCESENGYEVRVATKLGELVAWVFDRESPTVEAGVIYTDKKTGIQFDICMAEIKQGEIAEYSGKDENNEDVDVYIWEDPNSVSFSRKFTVFRKDIDKEVNNA